MRICTKCKIEKEESEFDKKGKGLSPHCKICRKQYVDNHYQNNKEYYKNKSKKSRSKYVDRYKRYKMALSCTDCGLSFKNEPYLCDFHHTDPSNKEGELSQLPSKKFLEEVKKCIPLCANCHRRRHNKQD